MRSGLSAFIHKSSIGNMESFEDLSKQEEVKYGTFRNSRTVSLFKESTDETIRRMYNSMMKNSFNFVYNRIKGIVYMT
jgi:hypothetical protein